MLITAGDVVELGRAGSIITIGELPKPEGSWRGNRSLSIGGKAGFELSYWCGTCPFLFERQIGANQRFSVPELSDRLTAGLQSIDAEIVEVFGSLLPPGRYRPILLTVTPRLTLPVKERDYFSEDQVQTWGVEPFWGLPKYPRTPYYRTFQTVRDERSHFYEFVVPMVPPSWNERERVAEMQGLLRSSDLPTAVAVSLLDVCAPAVALPGTEWYEHWCLTHFLLDGHHKIEAAEAEGTSLRLLSLLSIGGSLATPEQVAEVPALRQRTDSARPAAPRS